MRCLLASVLVLGSVAVAVAFPVRMANACECIAASDPSAPYAQVFAADAAVVGVVRDLGPPQQGISGPDTVPGTLDVEVSVHRDLGSRLDLMFDVTSSCALEVGIGDRVGLLLGPPGEDPSVGMCHEFDPDALLAATSLPEPTGAGPPAYAAAGGYGLAPVALLDAEGRVLGYGPWDQALPKPLREDRGHLEVSFLDACAGGQRIVERLGHVAWAGQRPAPRLVVRDTATGAVVSATGMEELLDDNPRSGPNVIHEAHCLTPDGSDFLVVLGYYEPPEVRPRRVVRITAEGFTTLAENTFHEVLPVGARALTRLGEGERLAWLDLASGATTDLLVLPADTDRMVLVPDASAALLTAGPDHLESAPESPSRLLRVNLAQPAISAEGEIAGTEGGWPPPVLPLSDGGALVSIRGGAEVVYRRYDSSLVEVESWTGPWLRIVERDGDLVGLDEEGRLQQRRSGEPAFTPMRGADLQIDQLLPLPSGSADFEPSQTPSLVVHRPDAPAPTSAPTVTPTGAESPRPSERPAAPGASEPSERGGPWAPLLLGAVAVAGLAAAGISRRRK